MEIKSASNVSIKSAGMSPFVQSVLGGGLAGGDVSMASSFSLWEISDTVYNCIDLVAGPFSQMEYSLRDKKTKELITGGSEHPFLNLLENPGYYQNQTEVMYSLMTSFLLGACYPKLIGNVKFEPSELQSVYGSKAQLIPDRNNKLQAILFSDNEDGNLYERQLIPKRKTAVYQSATGLAETKQITKARRRYGPYPTSPLSRIIQQIYTKVYGNQHNSSLLRNGSNPGGMWEPDTPLGQDQFEAFKTDVRNNFVGPQNAGRNVVVPRPIKYTKLSLTPSDMDFVNLIESSSTDIYNLYHIPLALISAKTMTMSNFENSQTALYDMAVLPNAYMVLKALGEFCLPRYPDGDRYELTFDEKTLPALRARMIEQAKKMRDVAAYTDDEIRTSTGYDMIDGGDIVWKPSTLIPANEDMDDLTGGEEEGEELEE